MRRALQAVGLGLVLVATPVLGAPGDPLGDDDTGCAPSTSAGITCAKKADNLLMKLRYKLIKCHLKQAKDAYNAGSGSAAISAAEEDCEAAAKDWFDDKIAGLTCDATVVANVNARRDIVLSDQTVAGSVDNLNNTFFCDATSGNAIDPGGDDGGFIPATSENYRCSTQVMMAWARLNGYVFKCHSKLAGTVFKGARSFNDDLCEQDDPTKSAFAKYYRTVIKSLDRGFCPPCLSDAGPTNALDLALSTIADTDANLQEIYICPGP